MTACREGKGVAQAVLQAKAASVPKEIIDRAITKGAVNPVTQQELQIRLKMYWKSMVAGLAVPDQRVIYLKNMLGYVLITQTLI